MGRKPVQTFDMMTITSLLQLVKIILCIVIYLMISTTSRALCLEVNGIRSLIEWFSFECRKVIGFALSTRCDWLKRFAPPFRPIRSKTKANCDALACIFPRFASATCNYFEF